MKIALEKATGDAPFVGKLIDWLSRYKGRGGYFHGELVFANGESLTATTDAGLIIHRRDFTPGRFTFWDIGRDWGEQRIRDWYAAERRVNPNEGYDWWGDFRFVLPWVKQHPTDYFCTEALVTGVEQIEVFAGVDAWQCSPNKVARMCRDAGFPESETLK